MNNADTNELHWVQFSGSSLTLTNSPVSFKAAGHRSQILLQTATGSQGSCCYVRQPTYCSRDKRLARPLINKTKRKETIFLPCLVCLLRNKSGNKCYELQNGEDSASRNMLMTYIQYIPQSYRKKKTIFINHTAIISIINSLTLCVCVFVCMCVSNCVCVCLIVCVHT